MKITALYHVSFEKLGYIEDWIIRKGHTLSEIRLFENQALPLVGDFDLLILMGGPVSVNDEAVFPWLESEKEFIRQSIQAGKAILGICLGAQLIASALGSKVYQSKEKEIGWFPVHFTRNLAITTQIPLMTEEMTVFHWHGETFDLPSGAEWLSKSEGTANQAFIYNQSILAVQFHLEMKPENISLMINHVGHELVPARFIQSAQDLSTGLVHVSENKALLESWLEYLEHSLIMNKTSDDVH